MLRTGSELRLKSDVWLAFCGWVPFWTAVELEKWDCGCECGFGWVRLDWIGLV